MGIFTFKSRRPKQFDYVPRYYDPEKEDREKRYAQSKRDAGKSNDKAYVPNVKGHFKSKTREPLYSESKYRSVRIIIIIISMILLMGVFYFVAILTSYILENG